MGRDHWPWPHRSVASFYIQEHALQSCTGRHCMGIGSMKQKSRDECFTRSCHLNCGWIAMLFFTGMIAAIVCVNVFIVQPHFKARGYVQSTCNVSSFDQHVKQCSCGRSCQGNNYCVKVNVTFSDGSETHFRNLLPNEDIQKKCAWESECRGGTVPSTTGLAEYVQSLNTTKTFTCFYDPQPGSTTVIKNKRYQTDAEAIVGIVFPVVGFIWSLIWLLLVFEGCGCNYFCDSNPPEDINLIVLNMQQSGIHTMLDSFEYEDRKRIVEQCSRGLMRNPPRQSNQGNRSHKSSTVMPAPATIAPPSYSQATKQAYPTGFAQPGQHISQSGYSTAHGQLVQPAEQPMGYSGQNITYDNPEFNSRYQTPAPAYSGTGGF